MKYFRDRKAQIEYKFTKHFKKQPLLWVQAPGRIDLMGSHTDYNQGYVLTQTVDRNTWIAARPRQDGFVRIESLNIEGGATFDLSNITFDQVHSWTNYIRGVAVMIQKEGYGLSGFDGLVHSTIPFGSGLSSSAALEMATAVLFEALGGWEIDPIQKAILCQRAENEFVGMNCGILDQYTSAMGEKGSVLLLDCRDITSKRIPVTSEVQVMICDTRAERALTGSEYPQRRAQCEEGVRILSRFYPHISALRDASLEQLTTHKEDMSPVVYKRCKFIIEENQRVLDLSLALATGDLERIGRLAQTSFAGARNLYEIVSAEMSDMFNAIMASPGALGARGAGAGFGGCLVAFVKAENIPDFTRQVLEKYKTSTGIHAEVYPAISSDGAGIIEIGI